MAVPAETIPNVVISLGVMSHKIRNQYTDILVMIDHSEMILYFRILHDSAALSFFDAFFSRWPQFLSLCNLY